MLFATTAITGPNGEQVDRDMPIPAVWDVNSDFVKEGIAHGWIVVREDPQGTPVLPAVPAPDHGHNPTTPTNHVDAGGQSARQGEGTV